MTIYRTKERKGHGRQNYYWNEYRREGDTVVKYRCNRRKHFDGHDNEWVTSENMEESWQIGDPSMPEWLNQYL